MSAAEFVAIDKHGNVAASIAQHHAQALVTNWSSPEEQLKLEKKRQKKYTVAICVIALSAFFVSLVAMWIEASIFVYLAFLFPICTGPYVVHQRRKLNKMPTLRHVMNLIRNQVNTLSHLNRQLHAENIRLSNQVARLNEAEAKLETVAKQAGSDVDRICQLVKENAETQRQMKSLMNAQELQNLLTAIMQSDRDGDSQLTVPEMELLMLRLPNFSAVEESKLREALMRAMTSTTSTTELYRITSSSFADETGERNNPALFDYTFGASAWLFDETA